jgi:hypothetical protein
MSHVLAHCNAQWKPCMKNTNGASTSKSQGNLFATTIIDLVPSGGSSTTIYSTNFHLGFHQQNPSTPLAQQTLEAPPQQTLDLQGHCSTPPSTSTSPLAQQTLEAPPQLTLDLQSHCSVPPSTSIERASSETVDQVLTDMAYQHTNPKPYALPGFQPLEVHH